MSAISNNDIARSIYLASKDVQDEKQFFEKVVQFLYKKRLLSKSEEIREILSHLNKIINTEEGILEVRVSSGQVLSETQKQNLKQALFTKYGAKYNTKNISVIYRVDDKLIGGYKIEIDDEVIDLTIKNKIGQLQEYLIKD